jgi:hypothetical protein
MSTEKPLIKHDLVEVTVILQGQVIFVCRCGIAFRFMSEFHAHKTTIDNPHPPAWKRIEDIAFAKDNEIIDELRCWNELDSALREIAAQQNKPE